MVSLVAPPASLTPDGPSQVEDRTGRLVAAGAGGAVLGAAVMLAMLSAVTVLLWALGPHTDSTITAAPFRGAATLWLMAQFAPVQLPTGELQIAPLVLAAGVAVLTARVAAWAVRYTRAFELRPAALVAGGLVLGHVVVATALAAFSSGGGAGVDVRDAVPAAAMFALVCTAVGVAPHSWWWARLAVGHAGELRAGARAAGAGAGVLLGGGAAIVLASLAWHHRDARAVLDALGGGLSGKAGTLLLCLALLPNAALWVVALGAGPGFALGTDAGLGLGGMADGAVPALPLLAALPAPGPLPAVAYVPLLLPVAAGAVIGWFARTPGGGRRAELARAVWGGLACGLAVGLLAWLSGGSAGGRLAEFGPGLAVAAALAGELAAIAALVVGARYGYERLRTPAPAEVEATVATAAVIPPVVEEVDDIAGIEEVDDIDDTQEIPVIAVASDGASEESPRAGAADDADDV